MSRWQGIGFVCLFVYLLIQVSVVHSVSRTGRPHGCGTHRIHGVWFNGLTIWFHCKLGFARWGIDILYIQVSNLIYIHAVEILLSVKFGRLSFVIKLCTILRQVL